VLQGDWTTVLLQMNVCSGSAMAFTPHSELDNGKLDAVMVLRSTRIKGVQFFDKLKKGGRHIYIDDVKYLRMCGLKVEPAKQSILMVDGEMPGMTPWRAVTEKGSWMTFVPPPPMSS
jgi:diacylglycerol kinase family enzyme